jgi:hypothetical protein
VEEGNKRPRKTTVMLAVSHFHGTGLATLQRLGIAGPSLKQSAAKTRILSPAAQFFERRCGQKNPRRICATRGVCPSVVGPAVTYRRALVAYQSMAAGSVHLYT